MSEGNSLVGRVYFEGDVQMPVPPEYFLQRLYDYDAMLVMFASAVRPGGYVLARKRERSPGLTSAALAIVANPDTRLCMGMGWVPVCMVYQAGLNWDPSQIIAKLKARDIRAMGGADKVADQLEAQEADDEKKLKADIRDDLWNRSGAAWRTYQSRTGQNNLLPLGELPKRTEHIGYLDSTPQAPVPDATVSTASTPRSTAGLGEQTLTTIGGEV